MRIIEPGSLPPIGIIPEYMYAQVLRKSRYGEPINAFKIEEIKIPHIKEDEVLVAVMSAGINYNSIWAAKAYPLDMISLMQNRGDSEEDFQILGSDCAGIVYQKGSKVQQVELGNEVVIQGGWYNKLEDHNIKGGDPTVSKSFRAWGYETNYGAYAQFCVVKDFQCLPKPKHLSWDEAAVYMVSGVTAYRMLHHYIPNNIKPDNIVLIWGGSGGLGSMAIQLVKEAGGIPVAVINSEAKKEFCEKLGAKTLNRSNYHHWNAINSNDVLPENQEIWRQKALPFLQDLLKITNGKYPDIVIEHPGESTFPTSLFVCKKEGMVITCAGTTGYLGSFDLRYLWLHNKRIQGSHYANEQECKNLNTMVTQRIINPVLSGYTTFEKLPTALQQMANNNHQPGSMAVRIGSLMS